MKEEEYIVAWMASSAKPIGSKMTTVTTSTNIYVSFSFVLLPPIPHSVRLSVNLCFNPAQVLLLSFHFSIRTRGEWSLNIRPSIDGVRLKKEKDSEWENIMMNNE